MPPLNLKSKLVSFLYPFIIYYLLFLKKKKNLISQSHHKILYDFYCFTKATQAALHLHNFKWPAIHGKKLFVEYSGISANEYSLSLESQGGFLLNNVVGLLHFPC